MQLRIIDVRSQSCTKRGSQDLMCISLTGSRVRVAAAESMPLLLECARVRGPEYLTQMWHFMCDALIKSIGTEPDSDVLSEIMHSFAKVTFFFFPFRVSIRIFLEFLNVFKII